MEKLRGIIGLPVLETGTGMQIGEVVEAVLDMEEMKVCGFVIADQKWFTTRQAIEFQEVFSIGRDAIMVRSQHGLGPLDAIIITDHPYYLQDVFDKQIFTDTGLCLGVLVDIGFDSATGEIKWYQVSDGIIMDILNGRRKMPLPPTQRIGPDKIIVPEVMMKLLQTEINTQENK